MKHSTENKLREEFKKGYSSIHRNGILQGATAIAKVVYDKANDISKTPEQRLEDIIRFCAVSLTERNEKQGDGSE